MKSCRCCHFGTILMLFPLHWHNYQSHKWNIKLQKFVLFSSLWQKVSKLLFSLLKIPLRISPFIFFIAPWGELNIEILWLWLPHLVKRCLSIVFAALYRLWQDLSPTFAWLWIFLRIFFRPIAALQHKSEVSLGTT